MRCKDDHSPKEWDVLLAEMGGHPLQSALWGEAKKTVYGKSQRFLAFYNENKIAALARAEQRGAKPFTKITWIPQGPTLASGIGWEDIQDDFLSYSKKTGDSLCIFSPWKPLPNSEKKQSRQTSWIDLSLGKEKLWSALDKQWRYGVRSALRLGAQNYFAISPQEVAEFYQLCITVSQKKTFRFQYNQAFMQYLLDHGDENSVEAKLFLVKCENKIAAGAFILRSGKNCHYMWGAVDRKYGKLRVGELVQWSVIEWACEKNCTLYDLEGIDEIKNPGVAAFKKKMGGQIIQLFGEQFHSFNWRGKILSSLVRKKLRCN
ncbi:MAG: FemA-related protein [uncultured bacterium]|nr:MAG: FemA-related protein [uncultured bacterium]OGT85750.1 MAG: hypothetical protein A3G86_03465 [Gammaproteobacteria bacterium RIFCSPLOWO2_12_FULL_42_18]